MTIHSSRDIFYLGDSADLTCSVSNNNHIDSGEVIWSKLNGDMEMNARAMGEKLRLAETQKTPLTLTRLQDRAGYQLGNISFRTITEVKQR